MSHPSEVTRILCEAERSEDLASEELLQVVYQDLRRMASRLMLNERRDHTLQATALVHEAFVRLVDVPHRQDWQTRGHFFAAAATAMRRILVDHARAKGRLKRNGSQVPLDMNQILCPQRPITAEQLLDLDEALTKFEQTDGQVAELVRLRLYAGLSVTEAAKVLNLSRTVAYERWDYALSWMTLELG